MLMGITPSHSPLDGHEERGVGRGKEWVGSLDRQPSLTSCPSANRHSGCPELDPRWEASEV
jgi:hypothetical protein